MTEIERSGGCGGDQSNGDGRRTSRETREERKWQ